MSVETTVRIKGDSTQAQAAVRGIADRMGDMGRAAVRGALDTAKMTAAVLGAESVVAGLRKALDGARAGVRDYLDANDEAAERVAALGEQFRATRMQIGEYVLGGENAAVITGTLSGVLAELTSTSSGTVAAQEAVRQAVAGAVSAMSIAVDVAANVRAGLASVQVVAIQVGGAIEQVGRRFDLFTTQIASAIANNLAPALRAVGLGSSELEGRARGLAASVEAQRRAIVDASAAQAASIDAVRASAGATVDRLREMSDSLFRLADGARTGDNAALSLRRQIDDVESSARRATAAVVDLKAAAAVEAAGLASRQKADEIAAKERAAADAAALASQRKADSIAALAAAEQAAREASIRAAEEQAARLEELDRRRAESARQAGAAVGESLAIAVSQQRDASQQITAIIARELQARITAAIASAAIFSATPGGQFAGAAIGAAAAFALGQLAQIGGGGGGGRGGGGRTSPTIGSLTVNVQAQGGAGGGLDVDAITAAVEDGVRRGTIRLGGR